MPKKIKIFVKLNKQESEGYANPFFEIDPYLYSLPGDLQNMTQDDKESILAQLRNDMQIPEALAYKDYQVSFYGDIIAVIPR